MPVNRYARVHAVLEVCTRNDASRLLEVRYLVCRVRCYTDSIRLMFDFVLPHLLTQPWGLGLDSIIFVLFVFSYILLDFFIGTVRCGLPPGAAAAAFCRNVVLQERCSAHVYRRAYCARELLRGHLLALLDGVKGALLPCHRMGATVGEAV